MDYLYIDESGDLGYNGSKYLVISAILIRQDGKPLEKIIKKVRKNFFKEIKESQELKATESSVKLNKYIIKKLNKTNSEIFSAILKKENRYKLYHNNDKNKLYDLLASKIANQIEIKNHLEVRVDKSKTTKEIQNFNEIFESNLNNMNNFRINIEHSYSQNYRGLQVVDCIAWSYFQKFENKNNEYVKLLKLKSNIIEI
ncbi:MAG: DUF3800 domain-containing protein [Methanobrevibacter sp.]|nr:DUF3800 domain-containing protein [Methanobrevibacter sp.]